MTPLSGSRVLVVGLGATGRAVVDALAGAGTSVTVVDAADTEPLREVAAALRARGVTVLLGVADADAYRAAGGPAVEVVIASPGVPERHPLLSLAATVYSEPELAWQLAGGRTRLLGVTGTNGKTTTTELLAACVGAPAGGNIGTPLVQLLGADPPPLVVAELSSFQLRFCETLRPDVAVLLNVAADHLDWHGDLHAYGAAKARLWQRQRDQDVLVVNADDAGAQAVVGRHPAPGRTVSFTLSAPGHDQVGVRDGRVVSRLAAAPATIAAVADLGVHGPHNVANVTAAVAAALSAGLPPGALEAPLRAYRAGHHRLEVVATVGGVTYVDDSKATNPHAAAAALASYPAGAVVWIAGGLGKGLTFEGLSGDVARAVHTAVTIGQAGPDLARVARDAGCQVVEAGTLDRAVTAAAAAARPGDVVLLAPACASMDQFRDYAHRGQVFRDAVLALRPPQEVAHGPR